MTERNPTLIVVAGPNGSGKTSFTTEVLQHAWVEGCNYINPDNIARDIYGDWNSETAVMAAARHAERERERCLSLRQSIAFETVLSAADKVAFIRRATAEGYFVRLFFFGTDHPSINAARVTKRVMEGGHDVPIPKIISRYSRSIGNCTAAAAFVDRAYICDNSVDGRKPELLFRTVKGRVAKVYREIHDWARPIADPLSA